jgi:hypothetical protein
LRLDGEKGAAEAGAEATRDVQSHPINEAAPVGVAEEFAVLAVGKAGSS